MTTVPRGGTVGVYNVTVSVFPRTETSTLSAATAGADHAIAATTAHASGRPVLGTYLSCAVDDSL